MKKPKKRKKFSRVVWVVFNGIDFPVEIYLLKMTAKASCRIDGYRSVRKCRLTEI